MLTRRSLTRSAFAAAAAAGFADVPPIGQLRSRRAEARPIPNAERQARVERARRLMRENHLDAIALAGGSSLLYFSGIRWGLSERLFVLSKLPGGLFPRREFSLGKKM